MKVLWSFLCGVFFLLEVSAQNLPASRGEEQFYAKTQTTQRRSFCEETQTCHGDALLTCNPPIMVTIIHHDQIPILKSPWLHLLVKILLLTFLGQFDGMLNLHIHFLPIPPTLKVS